MGIGQLRTVVVDCLDPEPLAEFWSAVLGVEIAFVEDDWASLRSAGPGHPRVAFQKVPETKRGKNRLHLDVWVPDLEAATVAAEALGATRLGRLVHESPEPFQVMADPAGNEFCFVHLPGSTGP
ncbi:MAG: VOC family protein [Acidimicrobiia bacterium]|nr:VOC family protein [Acidimicrobiia bacterium]